MGEYIKENGGIDTEEAYPYTAREGECYYRKRYIGAEDVGFVDVPSGSESSLKKAVALVGPVAVAIDASHMSFQLYDSGVYLLLLLPDQRSPPTSRKPKLLSRRPSTKSTLEAPPPLPSHPAPPWTLPPPFRLPETSVPPQPSAELVPLALPELAP